MIQQCYIKNKNYYLLACTYIPDVYDKVVILLQGYSHSMTDIDYFMTNVKNQLVKNKCAVVQFDPYGHGDSDGFIEQFSFNILIDDLITVTKWVELQFGIKPTFVTRGLFELAIYKTDIHNLFDKCIVINPVNLSYEEYQKIYKYTKGSERIVDFNKWYQNVQTCDKKIVEDLYYMFGAKLKNLQGQYLNLNILKIFLSLVKDRKMPVPINVYYVYSKSEGNIKLFNNCPFPCEYTLKDFSDYGALPRNPDWHLRIIDYIVKCCRNNSTLNV